MKKILTMCLVFLAGCAVYAQKPLEVCVAEDLSVAAPRDNDSRTCNLAEEYFKSELATHSGINIIQSDRLTSPALIARGFKRGSAIESAKVAAVCKELKADYMCFMRIIRQGDNKMESVVTIYTAAGAKKGEFKRPFESVRFSDVASILLAHDVAVALRGHNPVDDVNLIRVKQQREKMKLVPTRNENPLKADGTK